MAAGEVVVEVKLSRAALALALLRGIMAALVSAELWAMALIFIGFALIVAGVALIYGLGAALIVAGASCLLLAGFIFRGMTHV